MINLLRARAALAVVRMEMVDELAFDPDQLRDRRGRWVKDPRGAGGTPSLPRASAGGGAGAGGSAPARRSPNPRDFGSFTPSNDAIWAQSEQRLGGRTPLTDPNGIKARTVIPMDGGGWATVSQDPYTTPARKRGYVQIQADGEAYKRDYSMGLAQEMVRKNAAEREWRAAGGTREAFDRERESKAAPSAPSAVSEEPPAPKVNEYVPQHIREVQQYLSGERRAPLPLSYLYGDVGRESWEKHFTPEQRERVLGELMAIVAGMPEDARDRPRATAGIEALQPLVPGDHRALAVKTAERFLADRQKGLASIEDAEFGDDEISQKARRAQLEYAAKRVADAEAVVSKLKKAASGKRAQAQADSPAVAEPAAPRRNPRMRELDRRIAELEQLLDEPGEEYLRERRQEDLDLSKKARASFGDPLPGETDAEHEARILSKIKGAVAIMDDAKAAGWQTSAVHSTSNSGMPFVRVGVRNPDTGETIEATWHTQKNGTYRLFSQPMVTRVSDKGVFESGRRYGSTMTPTKLREIMAQEPAAGRVAA